MRERDLAWEAMVEVCGYGEQVTENERGRINAALKELRAIYPASTPYAVGFDIRARAEVYERRFPDMPLTPQALTGNWSLLDPASEKPPTSMPKPPRARCGTCGGDKLVLAAVRPDGAEEYAPCPDCHPNWAAVGHWDTDGKRVSPPDPVRTRQMMRLLEAHDGRQ
jgi:hypothetical protein